jgi:hypothetical protein
MQQQIQLMNPERIGQIDEPVEYDRARASAVKVGQGAEERRDANGEVRHAVLRTRLEDARCGALDRERVEAAAGDVEE